VAFKAVPPGRSVLDVLWQDLDSSMRMIMDNLVDDVDYTRGHMTATAQAIALLTNPLAPDLDDVRAEAMARYNDQVGPDEPAPESA
jgi:hypothetical protein